jgi:hypothetical protein
MERGPQQESCERRSEDDEDEEDVMPSHKSGNPRLQIAGLPVELTVVVSVWFGHPSLLLR